MAEWRAHWCAAPECRMVKRQSTRFLNRVRKFDSCRGHSSVERLDQARPAWPSRFHPFQPRRWPLPVTGWDGSRRLNLGARWRATGARPLAMRFASAESLIDVGDGGEDRLSGSFELGAVLFVRGFLPALYHRARHRRGEEGGEMLLRGECDRDRPTPSPTRPTKRLAGQEKLAWADK